MCTNVSIDFCIVLKGEKIIKDNSITSKHIYSFKKLSKIHAYISAEYKNVTTNKSVVQP